MARTELRAGNDADYAFGTEEGWDGFVVVDLHGVEEISHPFHYAITLARGIEHGRAPLSWFLDRPASLATATVDHAGFFLRHGIIAEAEQIDAIGDVEIYRVVLVPHFFRAKHRQRCRTFLAHSFRQIVSLVLQNGEERAGALSEGGPDGLEELTILPHVTETSSALNGRYEAPKTYFRWDVGGLRAQARVLDSSLYRYTVQYNESDFDFVARLLEKEGLSYLFEHAEGRTVLWITDQPGKNSIFAEPRTYEIAGRVRGMRPGRHELIRSFREALRMRSRKVRMRDYDWRRSTLTPEGAGVPGVDGPEHFEFPARDEESRDNPGAYPSQVRLERFEVERNLAEGCGPARGMRAGQRFMLLDAHEQLRGEHLLVRVETVAVQHHFSETALDDETFGFDGRTTRASPSFESRFSALLAELPYRPAMITKTPRIMGVGSAVVTDHEGKAGTSPEIFCDEWARVRVRFPWDQREDDRPSSDWIRVSQEWAGASFGALFIPRVGQEVLVAYDQGDPDRPIIVGRVYNAKNPLPFDAGKHPDQSTIKTHSTPGAEGSNELRFTDLRGHEQIFLHAQRNLDERVRNAHSTRVGGDQANIVDGYQNNYVKKDREQTVEGSELCGVFGDRLHRVGGFETINVGGDHTTSIGGQRTSEIAKGELYRVAEARSVMVGRDHSLHTSGSYVSVALDKHSFVSPDVSIAAGNTFTVGSTTTTMAQSASFVATVGGCTIELAPGMILLNNGAGASIALVGGSLFIKADGPLTVKGAVIDLNP
jgi:type VI secretion system secreted protein VgrG